MVLVVPRRDPYKKKWIFIIPCLLLFLCLCFNYHLGSFYYKCTSEDNQFDRSCSCTEYCNRLLYIENIYNLIIITLFILAFFNILSNYYWQTCIFMCLFLYSLQVIPIINNDELSRGDNFTMGIGFNILFQIISLLISLLVTIRTYYENNESII